MKKFLLISFLMLIGLSPLMAQDLIYRSYGTGQSQQEQPQSRAIKTTAYSVDYGGNYIKVPILVEEYGAGHYGGTSYYVVAIWKTNGYSGQWQKLANRVPVYGCTPAIANGNTARLERSYMYKAMVGSNWYYFDL